MLSGESHGVAAASEAELARAVARISSTFFLRVLGLLSQVQTGEILTGIVFQTIIVANTGHLEPASPGVPYDSADGVPSDADRRPASILSVSGMLGLPYETTRRHVIKLERAGLCVRGPHGVMVPQAVLLEPRMGGGAATNLANVRRFVRELAKVGLRAD